jgi:hypothetical protein
VKITRREMLVTSSVGLASVNSAWAMGEESRLGIALLRHGVGHSARPGAIEQLMWEASKRTSMRVRERPKLLSPTSKDLFRWPLLVWIGTGPCEPFPDEAVVRLRRYLRGGGALFISDASTVGDNRFHDCVQREMERVWPDRDWVRFGNDHTIFRTFYLLEEPQGRVVRQNALEGVVFDDRSPVMYERNDLFGAFGRDTIGSWRMPVSPGGRPQRERAFRLGINLLMYATCLNYKRDQVHVTAILRRRRWRVDANNRSR